MATAVVVCSEVESSSACVSSLDFGHPSELPFSCRRAVV